MTTQRQPVHLLLLGIFILVLSGVCRERSVVDPADDLDVMDPKKQEVVVLRVGSSTYTNADFLTSLDFLPEEERKTLLPDALSRLFDNFVEERIILEAARSDNLELTEEERDAYFEKFEQSASSDQGSTGLTDKEAEHLQERLLIEKYTYLLVQGLAVSDEEILSFYEDKKRNFLRPERVKVSQILVETRDAAIRILERVKDADEEAFRKVAREVSIGVEAEKGGLMGIFEMGQLPPDMEQVVFSLEEGKVSPVVESVYGFHIFRLDKRYEPRLMSEEDAAPEIRTKIMEQKIKQTIARHVLELKTNMEWTSYPENLSFLYQRQINEDI